jgi:hypothetical protein
MSDFSAGYASRRCRSRPYSPLRITGASSRRKNNLCAVLLFAVFINIISTYIDMQHIYFIQIKKTRSILRHKNFELREPWECSVAE